MTHYDPDEEWTTKVPAARWLVTGPRTVIALTFDLDTARAVMAWEEHQGRGCWLELVTPGLEDRGKRRQATRQARQRRRAAA